MFHGDAFEHDKPLQERERNVLIKPRVFLDLR